MTEELKIEQTEGLNAQAAEAEANTGAKKDEVSYGKFKDADALYSAYNSLQAEFTRRCQRLKELEEADKKTAERKNLGETDEKDGQASSCGRRENAPDNPRPERRSLPNEEEREKNSTRADALKQDLSIEAKGDEAPERVISEKEKEDVLKEYLEGILTKKTGAVLMDGAGASLKTPRARPRTVEEAGKLFRASVVNVK